VLHPTLALWKDPSPTSPTRREYEEILNALLQQHFIFHIVDGPALLAAQAEGGGLELGLARYKILLAPPGSGEGKAARAAGLEVLGEGWREALEARRALSVCGADGRELEQVWAAWREAGEQEILFLANTSSEAVRARVEVKADAQIWESWSLESGEATPIQMQAVVRPHGAPASTWSVEMAALGSALLVGSGAGRSRDSGPAAYTEPAGLGPAQSSSAQARTLRVARLPLSGEWRVELDRPNALRLNRWLAACVGGEWQGAADDAGWAEIEALPLRYRDTVRRGWREAVARREDEPVWYRRRVECEFVPGDAAILIEDGAILGRWTLWVNGEPVEQAAFEAAQLNGGDKVRAPVAGLLRRGENIIALKVEEAPEMGGLRTPLHLVGGFGLRGRTPVELSGRAPFNDLVSAGCPHFSGVATYSRRVDAGTWAQSDAVALPPGFGLVASARLGGHLLGTRAWSPYEFELSQEARQLAGEVEVEIEVTNTLLPFYEGQQWDASGHRALAV